MKRDSRPSSSFLRNPENQSVRSVFCVWGVQVQTGSLNKCITIIKTKNFEKYVQIQWNILQMKTRPPNNFSLGTTLEETLYKLMITIFKIKPKVRPEGQQRFGRAD